MAKKTKTNARARYREDLLDAPEWLKKKKMPHRDRYLAGKRILPKPLTGKETLADLVDEVFLAYNAARLQEACQLFTEKMLEPDVTVGMSISGALTPAGLGCSCHHPADQGRLRGLDRVHGREPVPRHALRAELPGARGQLQAGRHRAAQQRRRPHLRHRCSTTATA